MTLILELPDHKEALLKSKALQHGVSAERYVEHVLDISLAEHESGSIVEEMRALRSRVKPDPEGWTVHDYVQHGRQ